MVRLTRTDARPCSSQHTAALRSAIEEIFGRLDIDGDGSITEDDLPAMAEQGYHTRAQAALWETIKDFDLDGDNVVRTSRIPCHHPRLIMPAAARKQWE